MKRTLILLSMAALLAGALLSGCSRTGVKPETQPEESSMDEPEAPAGYVRGAWSGDTFNNEYLGLTFTLPQGWVAATEEEMFNSMALGGELLSDEQRAKSQLAQLTSVYDTTVSNLSTQSTLSIMAENLAMSLGGSSLTETGYAELMAQQLADTSLSYQVGETSERVIANRPYLLLPATIEGMPTVQWLFFRRMDDYMVCIVASFPETAQEEMEALLDSMQEL